MGVIITTTSNCHKELEMRPLERVFAERELARERSAATRKTTDDATTRRRDDATT